MRIDLRSLFPSVYDGYDEIDTLANVEQIQLAEMNQTMKQVKENQFVVLCNDEGTEAYERRFGIIADPIVEDMAFRKQRIINRISTKPPFTLQFLKNKLDELIGENQWNLIIDYDNFQIIIESSAVDQKWFLETSITLNQVKPCNIVFINKPLIHAQVNMDEELSLLVNKLNYKLGVTFILKGDPFAYIEDKGVIKMPELKSLNEKLLFACADSIQAMIKKIKLNDQVTLTEFKVKEANQDKIRIEYAVDLTAGLNEITNVKLLNEANETLTEINLFVPLLEPVVMKHLIRVKEG